MNKHVFVWTRNTIRINMNEVINEFFSSSSGSTVSVTLWFWTHDMHLAVCHWSTSWYLYDSLVEDVCTYFEPPHLNLVCTKVFMWPTTPGLSCKAIFVFGVLHVRFVFGFSIYKYPNVYCHVYRYIFAFGVLHVLFVFGFSIYKYPNVYCRRRGFCYVCPL